MHRARSSEVMATANGHQSSTIGSRFHVGDIEGSIEAMGLERPILVESMGGLNSIA